MILSETVSYDKEGRIDRFPIFKKLFIPITIILVAGLSFGIGRLSMVGKREPIRIEYSQEISDDELSNRLPDGRVSNQKQSPNVKTSQTASVINTIQTSTQVVGSKNGTKYHYPHCSGAKQIKEENKITFASPEAAQAAGYTLAANCKPR